MFSRVGLFVLLVLAGLLVFNVINAHRLRNELHAVREAGEPTTFEELSAMQIVVQDNENNTVFLRSFWPDLDGVVDEITMDETLVRDLPVLGNSGYAGWPAAYPEDRMKLAGLFLAEQEVLLGSLQPLAHMPHGFYSIDNDLDHASAESVIKWQLELPSGDGERTLSRLLSLQMMHEYGHIEVVQTTFNMLLHCNAGLSQYPQILAALRSMGVDALLLGDMEYILARREYPERVLLHIQRGLEKKMLRDDERLLRALLGERVLLISMFEQIRRGNLSIDAIGGNAKIQQCSDILNRVVPGWLQGDEAKAIALMSELIEIVKTDPPDLGRQVSRWRTSHASLSKVFNTMTLIAVKDYTNVVMLDHYIEAVARSAIVGMAVERYRLKTGEWPAALEELVPGYIETIPLDPFGQEPLRYRILDDHVVVYSVADDHADHGGDLKPVKGSYRTPDAGFRLLNPELRKTR